MNMNHDNAGISGNFVVALFRGKKAEDNPWEGVTLEWRLPSPPPKENFEEIPVISRGPTAASSRYRGCR